MKKSIEKAVAVLIFSWTYYCIGKSAVKKNAKISIIINMFYFEDFVIFYSIGSSGVFLTICLFLFFSWNSQINNFSKILNNINFCSFIMYLSTYYYYIQHQYAFKYVIGNDVSSTLISFYICCCFLFSYLLYFTMPAVIIFLFFLDKFKKKTIKIIRSDKPFQFNRILYLLVVSIPCLKTNVI